jgi:modification methylase
MTARQTLSVWPVAQQTARVQRAGRYLPASTAHPGKMMPNLAREAIIAYSEVGDLVLDPMCGIGTTLVEAVHLGRRAIGVELEPRWVALTAANLCLARDRGATGRGLVTRGDARRLGCGLLDELAGTVGLILTSPPYGDSLHGHVRKRPDRVEKYDDRYSHNPDNLAELPTRRGRRGRPAFGTALAEIFAGCRRLLAPGGFLVVTARPYRRRGELVDLPGQLEQLALEAGLELHDRLVALLCGLRGAELVPRASFFQLQKQRSGAIPRMLLIAHEDVLVFRREGPARQRLAT